MEFINTGYGGPISISSMCSSFWAFLPLPVYQICVQTFMLSNLKGERLHLPNKIVLRTKTLKPRNPRAFLPVASLDHILQSLCYLPSLLSPLPRHNTF